MVKSLPTTQRPLMLPRRPHLYRHPGSTRLFSSLSPSERFGLAYLAAAVFLASTTTVFAQSEIPARIAEPLAIERLEAPRSAQEVPHHPSTSELPSDQAIMDRISEFSTAYLRDLLGIYARLRNEEMTTALSGELRRRDPGNALPRSDDLLRAQAMDLETSPPSQEETLDDLIDRLISAERNAEALELMEKERATTFRNRIFPFELELGDAYATAGNLLSARGAYGRALASPTRSGLAREGLAELDRLETIEAGYQLMARNRDAAALKYAENLRQQSPDDIEVRLLHAEALVSNYHYMEALPMLEAIHSEHFTKAPFPARDALAECYRAIGRFDEAGTLYRTLAVDPSMPARERDDAIVDAREVGRMRTGNLHGDAEFLTENEGEGFMGHLRVSAPIGERNHAGVRAWAYNVSLSEERSLRQSSGSYYGATGFLRRYAGDNLHFIEGRGGGGDNGEASWGVTFGREAPCVGVLGFEVSADANLPAVDSLQLIALNATENRVEGSIILPLPYQLQLYASGWGRQVQADGADLGEGWGASIELGRILWENETETRQIHVAYQGYYESFDASRLSENEVGRLGFAGDPAEGRLLGDDLIAPLYHPHGVFFSYETQATNRLYYWAGSGLFFNFGDNSAEYHVSAGLDWAFRDSLSFYLEGGYYSNGVSAGNSESDVVVGTVGWRGFF